MSGKTGIINSKKTALSKSLLINKIKFQKSENKACFMCIFLLILRQMMKEKNKRMNEKTKLTFENVPEWTYWRNPNSGVIYHCGVNRNTWV